MKYLSFCVPLLFVSCVPSVTPNEFVVVTSDCWNHIEVIKAGKTPPRLLTACDRKIVLPAYLMDGTAEVPARFLGDVKGIIKFDYQYEIIDAIKFVSSAKFVTSSQTDDKGVVDMNVLERAENSVIDKIIKDVTRDYIPTVNPVDIEESKIEVDILMPVNKRLEERGIVLSTMSVDVDFKQQTEQALDVISAYNLYKNAGIPEIGARVIENQAGKPDMQVTVQNPQAGQ